MNRTHDDRDILHLGMSEFAEGNYLKSVEWLRQILEREPRHRLALTTIGAARLKLGDAEAAIADFSRAVEADPGYARAYHLRGLAREQEGDLEAALEDFGKAVSLDSEYGSAYYSRAALHFKMGRQDLAEKDIETVTHLTEHNMQAFGNENNVWRSQHLRVENALETELDR